MLSKKILKNPFARKSASYDPTATSQVLDINERFLQACENADLSTVNSILQNIKDFNVEVTDNLGRTALRLAVENENLEIVQVLLDKSDSQKIRDALLLAIFMGHTSIAEAILKHPKYKILNEKKFLNRDTDSFWQTPSSDDAQFSPDITPIMLAAQYNRTELVQMLLLNGDRISKPHDFNCKCTECLNKFKFDSLRHAQSRLNAYKGLASESYISLASIDPILTAFELSHELGILAEKEKYFKHEYLQLRHSLSTYSVKLLNNVRGRDELEIVLNKTGKEKEEKYEQLARLDLALRFQQKPFVAHSNCQQKLVEIWYSGIRKISKMNSFFIFMLIILHVVLLPMTSLFFIFLPDSKIGKFLSLPIIKFISHFASYLSFILIVITYNLQFVSDGTHLTRFSEIFPFYSSNFSSYTERQDLNYVIQFDDFFIRPNSPSSLDIILSIWIIGQTWHEFKKLFKIGIYNYLYSSFNTFNFLLNILYIGSFGLKYYTMSVVSDQLRKLSESSFWNKIARLNESDYVGQTDVYETFYWLNSDRFYWVSWDPINLSEGLFAVGTVFTLSRLCFYLPLSQKLGPLQITLGKMINDIVKFICIFIIVFLAFLFSMNNLFWYYNTDVRRQVEVKAPYNSENSENPYVTNAEEAFGTLGKTFRTLFFALYLIGDSKEGRVDPFNNQTTVTIGYFVFAMFHIANITILMSMLIAMMTKSYEKIIHHSDTEWKFARSKLYMEYIKDGFTLPVPLNLLPCPVSTYRSIKKMIDNYKEKRKLKSSNSISINAMDELPSVFEHKSQMQPSNAQISRQDTFSKIKRQSEPVELNALKVQNDSCYSENQKLTYRIVMERVVKRYLMHNQGDSDDSKNEFDEIKQELQMMKYEMENEMKKSKEDNFHNMFIINGSIEFVAEEIMKFCNQTNKENEESNVRFKELLNSHQKLFDSTILSLQEKTLTNMGQNSAFFPQTLTPEDNEVFFNNLQAEFVNRNDNSDSSMSFINNNLKNLSLNNLNGKKPLKVSFEFIDSKMYSSQLSRILEESTPSDI